MKTIKDKSNPRLYITSGRDFGHRIVCEGSSRALSRAGYLEMLAKRLDQDAKRRAARLQA